MAVTTTNLIMGPGNVYTGAVGATEPDDSAVNSTPAASAWTDVGGTMDGVTLNVNQTYTELVVDQVVDIPGRRLTKREVTVQTGLAEPTLDNLAIVLNGGTVDDQSGYSTYDPANTTSATQPTEKAVIFDGYAPSALRRRVILRKTLSVDNVGIPYKKDAQTVFPVTFSAHYVSTAISPFRVIDEAAA